MKLHLGCGKNIKEGYINVDNYIDFPGVEQIDILNLPYSDASVNEILAEHLIEHISFADEERFWMECSRVLIPGGKIIAETPDFEWLCEQFLESKDFFSEFYKVGADNHYFGNGNEKLQRWGILITHFYGNQNGDGQFHKNAYTAQKLTRIAKIVNLRQCNVLKTFNKGAQVLVATMTK
jgi:predicted SAM-dependent methyltransferase